MKLCGKKGWGGEIIFCQGQRNSKGVMILINKNVDLNVQIVRNDLQGRWIFLNMKVDEKDIWLINLYGPNQDDPYFFKNIYTNLLNLQATNDQIIMVGDYNTVLSTSMDCKGNHSTNYHHRALKEITNIMDTLEIVVIWKIKNSQAREIYMEDT